MKYFLGWLALVLYLPFAAATDFPVYVAPASEERTADHYCGIYCLYHAARMYNIKPDLDKIIDVNNFSGRNGSTPQDLIRVATELGLRSNFLPHVSYTDLMLIDVPLLALIKAHPDSDTANHWILIIHAKPHETTFYDASVGVLTVPSGEFQALWSGTAVTIQAADDDSPLLWSWSFLKVSMAVVLCILASISLWLVSRLGLPSGVTLVLLAVVFGSLSQVLFPTGFVHQQEAVSTLLAVHNPREIPKIGTEEVRHRLNGFTILDSRTKLQYYVMRLPGAIWFPYAGPYWKSKADAEKLPKDKPVLIYCNDDKCPWSTLLGQSSLFKDFPEIYVLREGVFGFADLGGPTEPDATNQK